MNFLFDLCSAEHKSRNKVEFPITLNHYLNKIFNYEEINDIILTAVLQQVCYYPIIFWNKDWKQRHKTTQKPIYPVKRKEYVANRRISLSSFELDDIYSYSNNNFQEINLFSFPSSREYNKKEDIIHRNVSQKNLLSVSWEDSKNIKEYIIPYSSVANSFIDFKYNLEEFENKPIQFKIINPINNNELILTIFTTKKEIIWIPILYCKTNLNYEQLKNESFNLIHLLFRNTEFMDFFLSNQISPSYNFLLLGHHTSIFTTYELYMYLNQTFLQTTIKLFFYQPVVLDDTLFWKNIFDLAYKRTAYIFSFQKPPTINPFYTQFIHYIPESYLKTIVSLYQVDVGFKSGRKCNSTNLSGIHNDGCRKNCFCLCLFSDDITVVNRKKNIRSFVHALLDCYYEI